MSSRPSSSASELPFLYANQLPSNPSNIAASSGMDIISEMRSTLSTPRTRDNFVSSQSNDNTWSSFNDIYTYALPTNMGPTHRFSVHEDPQYTPIHYTDTESSEAESTNFDTPQSSAFGHSLSTSYEEVDDFRIGDKFFDVDTPESTNRVLTVIGMLPSYPNIRGETEQLSMLNLEDTESTTPKQTQFNDLKIELKPAPRLRTGRTISDLGEEYPEDENEGITSKRRLRKKKKKVGIHFKEDERSFRSLKSVMKVERTTHDNHRHECPRCKKVFKQRSQIKRHIDCVHLKLTKYVCPFCVIKFKRSDHLTNHVKRIHPEKFNEFLVTKKRHRVKQR